MDSINLLLSIMSLKGVKGYTKTDRGKLSETLNKAIPAAKKAIFDFLFRKRDPSLMYKAKYALETIKTIKPEDTALTHLENMLLNTGPAVLAMIAGAFKSDPAATQGSLKDIGIAVKEFY